MAEYQSKYHKFICDFFRYLSFASVVVTLFLFLGNLWFGFIPAKMFSKLITTTIAILFASGLIGIIFAEKKEKK